MLKKNREGRYRNNTFHRIKELKLLIADAKKLGFLPGLIKEYKKQLAVLEAEK